MGVQKVCTLSLQVVMTLPVECGRANSMRGPAYNFQTPIPCLMPVTQLHPAAVVPAPEFPEPSQRAAGDQVLKHTSLWGYFNTQILTTSELGGVANWWAGDVVASHDPHSDPARHYLCVSLCQTLNTNMSGGLNIETLENCNSCLTRVSLVAPPAYSAWVVCQSQTAGAHLEKGSFCAGEQDSLEQS